MNITNPMGCTDHSGILKDLPDNNILNLSIGFKVHATSCLV